MSERAPLDTAFSRFRRMDQRRVGSPITRFMRGLEATVTQWGVDASAVTLAAELADLEAPEHRAPLILAGLVTLVDAQQGSTRTALKQHFSDQAAAIAQAALFDGAPWTAKALADAAEALIRSETLSIVGTAVEDRRPFILQDGHLYMQRMLHAEVALAGRLRARIEAEAAVDSESISKAWDDVAARPAVRKGTPITLSDEQKAAVRRAAGQSLTFVAGGPGTGKTSIVVAMLRVLVRLGLDPASVALAAPTGKAAWRMGDAISSALDAVADPAEIDTRLRAETPVAQTLHRLLGYSPTTERFAHDADNPLSAEVVIVDEGSMIDLFLMERLLAAVRPDARLVVLGDADQLPSVAAGAVFRDVGAAAPQASARLTQSYRMRADNKNGAAILTAAQCIGRGEPPAIPLRADAGALAWAGIEQVVLDVPARRAFWQTWADRHRLEPRLVQRTWRVDSEGLAAFQTHDLDALFAANERARILCLTRVMDTGAERINAQMHEQHAKRVGQPTQVPILVGEPVMMLHNDYDRMLFNGDQGLTLWVEEPDGRRPMAVFAKAGGGYRAFHLDALGNRVTLCYAMTVHKSQGSEFESLALVLPEEDLPLLSRPLLYTAVTRSKQSVVVIGAPEMLAIGVARASERDSGLADRLAGRDDSPDAPG